MKNSLTHFLLDKARGITRDPFQDTLFSGHLSIGNRPDFCALGEEQMNSNLLEEEKKYLHIKYNNEHFTKGARAFLMSQHQKDSG